MVKSTVAIDGPRVRFAADASAIPSRVLPSFRPLGSVVERVTSNDKVVSSILAVGKISIQTISVYSLFCPLNHFPVTPDNTPCKMSSMPGSECAPRGSRLRPTQLPIRWSRVLNNVCGPLSWDGTRDGP